MMTAGRETINRAWEEKGREVVDQEERRRRSSYGQLILESTDGVFWLIGVRCRFDF